jgi:Methyltransferase domain
MSLDPFRNDPDRWGTSMAQSAELMLPCLEAANVKSIVEVGAFAGDLTRVLVDWAETAGARVAAVDPSPQEGLVTLARERAGLELIREPSLEALPALPELPDAVVIDGDHNYFTVREELRLIGERAPGADLPLLLFHDVCWPHGRRDDYFAPESIPERYRRPLADGAGGLFPDEPGLRPGGLPYPRSAAREGGPDNGVLTAIEEFAAGRARVRLVVVPVFFGLGVAWHQDAPWSGALAGILDPWDRNPILERLEANRVHHLAQGHARLVELWEERERRARQEAVLRRLLESSAFAVAERLSRLRSRAGVATEQAVVSKEEVRRALED